MKNMLVDVYTAANRTVSITADVVNLEFATQYGELRVMIAKDGNMSLHAISGDGEVLKEIECASLHAIINYMEPHAPNTQATQGS